MKRKITETKNFSKSINFLLQKRQLLKGDYESFKEELVTNPAGGNLIVGTGGIRKIRLKSASKGKSGGFRVCYYYLLQNEEIYLLVIYGKNEKENLTMEEKRILKEYVHFLKGAKHE